MVRYDDEERRVGEEATMQGKMRAGWDYSGEKSLLLKYKDLS